MSWSPDRDALRGRVAVVAGATRGAGRGIAAALGEAGACVICTGRSSIAGRDRSDYERNETIEETADLVRSMTLPMAYEYSGSPLTLTSSPLTTCCRF
jgi:NAD(P)-dependent dehydrogenase (short-subunit alcohol dehydrogenase family)